MSCHTKEEKAEICSSAHLYIVATLYNLYHAYSGGDLHYIDQINDFYLSYVASAQSIRMYRASFSIVAYILIRACLALIAPGSEDSGNL